MYALVDVDEFITYKMFVNKTVLVGDFVELSYIVGAGDNIDPVGFINCQRSGSTLDEPLYLPIIGGVITEAIPDTYAREQIPAVASSVMFAVSCLFVSGLHSTHVHTTIKVQDMIKVFYTLQFPPPW